ncbi:sigma 54-interacting transcriptional regulator [Brevibacillus composti]|uniref:HTH-type transcriptional regulatory protein TyrR n=1 Tax=Brevibacillus composti TaxID=2796470 RepID=A0A7T5JPY8_9BACL|nr:sigma 54-interacting transcriptional regulator [Brevibacillus composti]QQE75794.1 sigma 54-interacting transcriptional regulator [Brevibacillus composti]QUO42820.1 sigma 54-interacting transcriptional regulator [Brevibacillus composti]
MRNLIEMNKTGISTETLMKILDHSSDEIFVLDKNRRIIYVNNVSERHYGLKPSDIIGKYNEDLVSKGYWGPSIIPIVMKEKVPVTIRQTTCIGAELITTAIPILNNENEIELIVTTSHEQNFINLYISAEEKNGEAKETHSISENIITNNEKMENLIKYCKKVAQVDTTILIQGESGTGKSVLASYIHKLSHRKNAPFLAINCAAIPEELLESELFGYSQGAFTGANRGGKIGLLEAADQGTIFLDEIGEISPKIQAKLLQVIQERQFLPVGGTEVKTVDIRIIAATNQNLLQMVENKQFREDLYYRLNVIELKLPPLRERKEDIVPLIYYFLNKCNQKYQTSHIISQEALDILAGYSWPGNVRQLENVIERLVVTCDGVIQASDLPDIILQNTKPKLPHSSPVSLDLAVQEYEKELVVNSYKKHKSSRKVAADLNISQTKASRLIRKYCQDLDQDL